MRKRNFKLIRKTVEWLHRIKGSDAVKLPVNTPGESYKYFKIYGSNAEDGAGVGDYDEDTGKYSVPVHIHGKNLMGGTEFMDIHAALKISSVPANIVSGCYTVTPMPEYNGTVIIGPKHVKFKEKTAYTMAFHVKFMHSATSRRFGFRFDYSDGTYFYPVLQSSYRNLYLCYSSDPNKDLVAISSHAEGLENMRLDLIGFGLYEGEYTDYDTVNKDYVGERLSISIDAPLRKINYTSDVADIVNGTVTRKIKTVTIDSTAQISETDSEGIFSVALPTPMRPGSSIASPFEELGENSDSGLSPLPDGSGFLFKASPDITSIDSLMSYLNENPFEISYIMSEYEHTAISKTVLNPYEEELTMETLCASVPSKIIAEYS